MKRLFVLLAVVLGVTALALSQAPVSAQTPPPFTSKIEFSGVVKVITASEWTISGLKIQITGSTKIKGDPKVNNIVKVSGTLAEDGTITAREVKLAGGERGKEKREAKGEVEGAITALDAGAKTVTIRAKNGTEATYKVTPATKLELDGADTFESLTVGMRAEAKFIRGSNELLELEAKHEKGKKGEVEGAIIALDTGAKTVTIRAKNGTEATYKVTPATKLELDGADTFESLTVGMRAEAKFIRGSNELLELEAKHEKGKKGEVEGAIIALDTGAKTVTIRAKNGTEATYKVTPATKLELDGAGSFENLKAGTKVEAKFIPSTNELIELEVED